MLRIIVGMCLVVLAIRGLDWVEQVELARLKAANEAHDAEALRLLQAGEGYVDDIR